MPNHVIAILKDFLAWDYIRTKEGRTFINDNQTIIGNNYSAWQTETEFSDSGIGILMCMP